MEIIDLSVLIENQLPSDPPHMIPNIQYLTHKDPCALAAMQRYFPGLTWSDLPDSEAWANENISLTTHTGTHMDAPWHYHSTMNEGEPAWTIDQVPLSWCIGDGVVVDFSEKPDGYLCEPEDFRRYFKEINYTLKPNDIVLLHTSAPTRWGKKEYLNAGCGVGREGTLWLIEQGVHTVGTDAWSWDVPLSFQNKKFQETHDPSCIWEGHKAGKEHAYLQMEKLTNLDKLPPYGFRFIALPAKIKGASAGWVRAVALLD